MSRLEATRSQPRTQEPESVLELVVAAREGDEAAFGRLYERFHRAIHAVALVRLSGRDADDLVQDVFVEAWLKLGALRDPAAFPGWLLKLARNRAIDHARRVGPIPPAPERVTELPPVAEANAALRAIRDLPEAYRETLIMRLVEGLTGPEIAARTDRSAESVRVNLHRGFALLRERLGGRP